LLEVSTSGERADNMFKERQSRGPRGLLKTKKEVKMWWGWRRPLEGKVMVNMDTSFDETTRRGSVGAIIRD